MMLAQDRHAQGNRRGVQLTQLHRWSQSDKACKRTAGWHLTQRSISQQDKL